MPTLLQLALEQHLTRESGRALARRLGVDKDRVPAWRKGTRPRRQILQRLADELGYPLSELEDETVLARQLEVHEGASALRSASAIPDEIASLLRRLALLAPFAQYLDDQVKAVPDLLDQLRRAQQLVDELQL